MMSAYAIKDLSTIEHLAIHPGGSRVLEKIEKILNIPSMRNISAHEILKNYGNMSLLTLLFILHHLLQSVSATNHNQQVLAMAFGLWLAIESTLMRLAIGDIHKTNLLTNKNFETFVIFLRPQLNSAIIRLAFAAYLLRSLRSTGNAIYAS